MKNLIFLTLLIIFFTSTSETQSKNKSESEEGNKMKKSLSSKKSKTTLIQKKSSDKTTKTYTEEKAKAQNRNLKIKPEAGLTQNNARKQFKEIDFFNVKVSACSHDNCYPTFGVCTTNTNCHCINGHANLFDKGFKKNCDYVQKKQTTAFLLEFFLPFGTGLFYVGLWGIGLIKFLFTAIIPIALYITMYLIRKLKSHIYILIICTVLVTTIWWLVDIILFGLNKYRDSNGVPLKEW